MLRPLLYLAHYWETQSRLFKARSGQTSTLARQYSAPAYRPFVLCFQASQLSLARFGSVMLRSYARVAIARKQTHMKKLTLHWGPVTQKLLRGTVEAQNQVRRLRHLYNTKTIMKKEDIRLTQSKWAKLWTLSECLFSFKVKQCRVV